MLGTTFWTDELIMTTRTRRRDIPNGSRTWLSYDSAGHQTSPISHQRSAKLAFAVATRSPGAAVQMGSDPIYCLPGTVASGGSFSASAGLCEYETLIKAPSGSGISCGRFRPHSSATLTFWSGCLKGQVGLASTPFMATALVSSSVLLASRMDSHGFTCKLLELSFSNHAGGCIRPMSTFGPG